MTTKLSKLLDALKAQASDEHGDEFSRIVELNARLLQQDEQTLNELQHMLDGHEERRAEIHRRAISLAHRIGALPPPAREPTPIEHDGFNPPRFIGASDRMEREVLQ